MAPKGGGGRGGGGGSRGGGGGISCGEGAFTDSFSIAQLVLPIISAFLLICTVFFWFSKRKANREGVRVVLRWYSFGLSILFLFIANVLDISTMITLECGGFNNSVTGQSLAATWFYIISSVFLLGVVLIPFIGYLYKNNGATAKSKIIKIVNFIGIGLLTIYALAMLGLYTYVNNPDFQSQIDNTYAQYNFFVATSRVIGGFYTLYFIGCVWAAVLMLIPLVRMRSHGIVSGGLKFKIPLFAIIFTIRALLRTAYQWSTVYNSINTREQYIAWGVVFVAFDILVYILLIVVCASPALAVNKGLYNAMTAHGATVTKAPDNTSYASPAPAPVPAYTAYNGAHGQYQQPLYGAGPNAPQQWNTYAPAPVPPGHTAYGHNPHY